MNFGVYACKLSRDGWNRSEICFATFGTTDITKEEDDDDDDDSVWLSFDVEEKKVDELSSG